MGRLIDADKLIILAENTFARPNGFIRLIEETETAYNVDAVVAELEEEREYSYADFEEYVNEKSPCLDAEYDNYFHRGLERAIKLVKRGGIE